MLPLAHHPYWPAQADVSEVYTPASNCIFHSFLDTPLEIPTSFSTQHVQNWTMILTTKPLPHLRRGAIIFPLLPSKAFSLLLSCPSITLTFRIFVLICFLPTPSIVLVQILISSSPALLIWPLKWIFPLHF